ncbi:MAG: restriction endonuclease, partial [Acidobacteria bacterium]|nr:restriction endonuclease [Acidobacteriota bacterium]
ESKTAEISTDDGIETTEEEIEGYHIIKAIVREVVAPSRVVHRDTKSYMGILLDDNNRKPICRLRFNWTQKYLGVFDEDKNETKHTLESIDDIYKFAEQLKETALRYDNQ